MLALRLIALVLLALNAAAKISSPCKYCEFCDYCEDKESGCPLCPCEKSPKTPNCHMCVYCKYCKFCTVCSFMCNKDGTDRFTSGINNVVETLTSFGYKAKHLMGFKSDVDEATDAAEKDGIDQEKLDAEIEKIKKDL